MKDNATPGSTSTEEKVEIVIAPPYKKLAEFNVDVSKESSISMVLCGNVNEKQIGSSTREEEPVLVINSTSSSEDNETRMRHFKLYRAALKGNWNTADIIYEKDKNYITAKLSKEGDTALHIAAAARHTGFVKKLLEQMQMEDLTIKNNAGNTAFFLAAASGEVDIAEAMMEKNGDLVMIRGEDDMLPLHKAALMGNKEMVEYLYQGSGYELLDHDNDLIELLVSLINCRLYDVAFNLVRRHPELATARNKNEETALHALACMLVLMRFLDRPVAGVLKRLFNISWGRLWLKEREKQRRNNKLGWRVQLKKREKEWRRSLTWRSWMRDLTLTGEETPDSAFDLVRCLVMFLGDSDILDIIRKPRPLIFEAAKRGNIKFLRIILDAYPDLIFEIDENNYSIFHFAVLYRHQLVFKIIYEIGSLKDLVLQNKDNEGNNILHLAARVPPSDSSNIESAGVLAKLRGELLWFKAVEKILHPLDAEATNKEGKTAKAIFNEQHKELKDKAERWIKDTVSSCLMAATIIATVVFAAAFTVPGGTKEETGTPNFVRKASFIIFAISDAIALVLSSFSILSFLSVFHCRYVEEDFLLLLPHNLAVGLDTLALSVAAMMVVFSATMFIVFKDGMLYVPILVTIMASLPVYKFMQKFLTASFLFKSLHGEGSFE